METELELNSIIYTAQPLSGGWYRIYKNSIPLIKNKAGVGTNKSKRKLRQQLMKTKNPKKILHSLQKQIITKIGKYLSNSIAVSGDGFFICKKKTGHGIANIYKINTKIKKRGNKSSEAGGSWPHLFNNFDFAHRAKRV